MVSVQNSMVNPPQQNAALNLGVVTPPDKFYKPVLYSHAEATKKFHALNRDVYTMQKQISFQETKKTPKSVFYILGAGILAAGGVAAKFLLRKKV